MFGVALLTSTLLVLADARIYERCELARDLLSLGISKEHLATWVCIAFHESRFDTAARNPHSGDHGLLQISELYWCGAGKACGLPCSALRDDDISDDVECALRVYEEHTRLQGNGFLAWVVYPHHCKHNAKKYLADCDGSVKTPSVRPNGRARVMKVETRNNTNFSYNPKIDELLPPYLAVNSFLRGNYEKEFEQNYNNKVRINWLNYKIDNIDDLKLPVFNQQFREGYTTTTLRATTTVATTTTTPSPLPKIKPPSPRRIESNSFRRRKMRPLETAPIKFSGSTDLPITTTSISSTISPLNVYKSTIEHYVTQDNGLQSTPTYIAPISKRTTTIKPLTNLVESSAFVTSDVSHTISETTKLPILQTSTAVLNSAKENTYIGTTPKKISPVTEKSSQYGVSTITLVDRKTTAKPVQSTHIDKIFTPTLNAIKNKESINELQSNIPIVPTSTSRPLSTAGLSKSYSYRFDATKSNVTSPTLGTTSTTPRTQSRTWHTWSTTPRTTPNTPPTPRTRSRTWPTWRTSSAFKSTTESTSPKTSTRSWRTSKYTFSPTETFNNISATKLSNEQTTTLKPPTTTRSWTAAKSLSQSQGSNNNTSSTRNLLVEFTTAKPRATWPAANPRSTLGPATKPPTRVSTTTVARDTPSPTTARTTQSIFDLYLNPTKRPTLPFSFAPFKHSGLSLKIFAGGTTTHSPSFSTSEAPKSKTTSGDATKNQIRRQISQNM